jgi:hypothetical protein
MFQYAFGQTLKKATCDKVFYDTSWFKEAEESIVNESTKENYTYIESGECSQILKDFFKKLREDKHN